MRKIAIVGSRDYPSAKAVYQFVDNLPLDTIIVSGGCPKGVDIWAETAAKSRGMQVEIYKADWQTYGKRAGFVRNEVIADVCDELVAFWDGKSNGTRHTIKQAQQYLNKPVLVFGPPIVPINTDESCNHGSIKYGKEFTLQSAG